MNSKKVQNGKWNAVTCAGLSKGHQSHLKARYVAPRCCHECNAIITHTGPAAWERRLHRQVLRAWQGRVWGIEVNTHSSTEDLEPAEFWAFLTLKPAAHTFRWWRWTHVHVHLCKFFPPHLPKPTRKWDSYFSSSNQLHWKITAMGPWGHGASREGLGIGRSRS